MRQNPKLAKALAAALAATPVAPHGASEAQAFFGFWKKTETQVALKNADDAFAEIMQIKPIKEEGWDRFDAEDKARKHVLKVLRETANDAKLPLAMRVASEYPKNKIGEIIAAQLLRDYKKWKTGEKDWGVIKKLAERSPFDFMFAANEVADMPDAAYLTRKTLSQYAVAISYFELYNKIPGAIDILIENIKDPASTSYEEVDALLASNLITEVDKKRIRDSLPPRSRQLFLTILSLQHIKPIAVKSNLTANQAFNSVDAKIIAIVAKHLKSKAIQFDEAELQRWRKHLVKPYGSEFDKKASEYRVAMLQEVKDTYDVHPLQLMYRTAQVAQYIINKNMSLNEANIEKALIAIESARNEQMHKTIPKNTVVLTHNEMYQGAPAMAQPHKLKAIKDQTTAEGGAYVHVSGDAPNAVELAAQAILNAPKGLTLRVFAHGSPDGIYLSDGGQDLGGGSVVSSSKSRYISPQALAEMFAARYRDGTKSPEDDIILSHACYQSDYVIKFARAAAQLGFHIPLFIAPSEQGTTVTGHASTSLGTKSEEHWIKAKTRGDLFTQEFSPDTAAHPSIFAPDKSILPKRAPFSIHGHTPVLMQISGIDTYQGTAIG